MEKILQLQGKIQSLDPLGADAIFAHLPTYNTMRNVQGLIDVTRSVLPTLETVAHFDQEEAHATRPSLTTQLEAALAHRVSFTPLQKEALLSVSQILATLIKFRQPHKKLAYVTYEERYKIDPCAGYFGYPF
jgi:hypothetical protein